MRVGMLCIIIVIILTPDCSFNWWSSPTF